MVLFCLNVNIQHKIVNQHVTSFLMKFSGNLRSKYYFIPVNLKNCYFNLNPFVLRNSVLKKTTFNN